MSLRTRLAVASAAVLVAAAFTTARAQYWVTPMTTVHNAYKAAYPTEAKTNLKIARWGDSNTVANAFFAGFQEFTRWRNITTTGEVNEQLALEWFKGSLPVDCWTWQSTNSDLHGAMSGSQSGWALQDTIQAGTRNIDYWLATDKPAGAIIMWGTNDLANGVSLATYVSNMQNIVQTCKAFGTVPILTTIPPRSGYEAETVGTPYGPRGTWIQAIINLATTEQVPLIDLNYSILEYNPYSWLGTFINAADGVHLTVPANNPPTDDDWMMMFDFSTAIVSSWGYPLRNYLTLHMVYDEVNLKVWKFVPTPPVTIKTYDIGTADVSALTQPIRVFPIPATAKNDTDARVATAGGWAQAELVYNNWAEGLVFSTPTLAGYAPFPPYNSHVALPITKQKIVIHGAWQPRRAEPYEDLDANNAYTRVDTFTDTNSNGVWDEGEPYDDLDGNGAYTAVAEPFTDMNGDGVWTAATAVTPNNTFVVDDTSFMFYVTPEDTDATKDKRYPSRVPRLARAHGDDYAIELGQTADDSFGGDYLPVIFEFPTPVKAFGVFLPAGSNNWTNDTAQIYNDHNYYKQGKSVFVTVMDQSNMPVQLYKSLRVGGVSSFCPFLVTVSDGVNMIKKVSIIHDVNESTGQGGAVTFMDAYIVPGPVQNAAPVIDSITTGVAVYEGNNVSLTVAAHDDDEDTLSYAWTQVAGQAVTNAAGANTATFSCKAPALLSTRTGGSLSLKVDVTDGNGGAADATTAVQVYMAGDANHDWYVNVGDLQSLVAQWGSSSGGSADFNADGYVNVGDLQALVASWGRSL